LQHRLTVEGEALARRAPVGAAVERSGRLTPRRWFIDELTALQWGTAWAMSRSGSGRSSSNRRAPRPDKAGFSFAPVRRRRRQSSQAACAK
jgi:hypothetical protein